MVLNNRMVTLLTVFLFASFTLISCDDDPVSSDDDLGAGSVSVSGDVNADASGIADFSGIEDGPGGVHSWSITVNDFNPQTFSLQFLHVAHDPISHPAEGTYEIGMGSSTPFDEEDDMAFTGIYTHIENGDFMNAVEYSTLPCDEDSDFEGTLTIESSESDLISGSFQFTAAYYDYDDMGNCEIHGTIDVSGDFTAIERTD
jgi:hypothetical protein